LLPALPGALSRLSLLLLAGLLPAALLAATLLLATLLLLARLLLRILIHGVSFRCQCSPAATPNNARPRTAVPSAEPTKTGGTAGSRARSVRYRNQQRGYPDGTLFAALAARNTASTSAAHLGLRRPALEFGRVRKGLVAARAHGSAGGDLITSMFLAIAAPPTPC
jgi:hypothetical protein